MSSFENKVKNKEKMNKCFHTFYQNLADNTSYLIKDANRYVKSVKKTSYQSAKTYEDVTGFVDKNYTDNKNKLAFEKYIAETRKEILGMSDIAPKEKFEKIDDALDGKLNVYSDDFQANLRKTLKSQVEEKDVFLQLVYNLTMGQIEADYLKLGLPAEKYKLKIKDETNKEKIKSV